MHPSILLLFALIGHVFTGNITVSKSKERLTKGESLEVSWQVNIAEGERILALNILVNGDNAPIASGSINGFSTYPHSEKYFEKRLEANFREDDSGKFYTFTISNLNVNNDSVTLKGELITKLSRDTLTSEADISLDVMAPPEFLTWLPKKIDLLENEVQSLNVTVYGKPKPTSIWTIDGKPLSLFNSTKVADHTYNYVYELGPLKPADCGRILKYSFTDNHTVIDGNSTVNVLFTPKVVNSLDAYQSLDNNVTVTWTAVESGKCHLSYHVQFLNHSRNVIYEEGNLTQTMFTLKDNGNATIVRVRALYIDKYGQYLEKSIPAPATTTTTTTTTTSGIVITPRPLTTPKPSNNGLIIGVAVGLTVTIMLVVVIVIFILKKKKAKQSKKSDDIPLHERAGAFDEGDYASAGPPFKPNVDPDQMIYAELGAGGGRTGPKPDPVQSNYAEVKVDEMGYPARGPTSDVPSPSMNRNFSGRYNRPPSDEPDSITV